MKRHSQPPAANYVNWIGRTVKQVREEARLRDELVECVRIVRKNSSRDEPQTIRDQAHGALPAPAERRIVSADPAQPTPLGWSRAQLPPLRDRPAALAACPWLLAIPMLDPARRRSSGSSLRSWRSAPCCSCSSLDPLRCRSHSPSSSSLGLMAGSAVHPVSAADRAGAGRGRGVPVGAASCTRRRSRRSSIGPRSSHILELSALEDYDVTNQFTALGSVKPSRFRRVLFPVILWLIDYFARHVFGRGHLGRIRTIHFARWVFLDGQEADGLREQLRRQP